MGAFSPSPNQPTAGVLGRLCRRRSVSRSALRTSPPATCWRMRSRARPRRWNGRTTTRHSFYNVLDPSKRVRIKSFATVWARHPIQRYLHEPDVERFVVDVLGKPPAASILLIGSNSPLTTEIRCLRSGDARGEFRIVLPRVQETEYDLTHRGESFFIRTNDGAKTFPRRGSSGFRILPKPTGKRFCPRGRMSLSRESLRSRNTSSLRSAIWD